MAVMEIARMYPERVPAEVVIENSGIAEKEEIIDKLVPAVAGGGQVQADRRRKRKVIETTKDNVNALTG
jgi:hypothetical protein